MKFATLLLLWLSISAAGAEERPKPSSIYEDMPDLIRNIPEVGLIRNYDSWSPLTLTFTDPRIEAIPSEFKGLRIVDGQFTVTCSEVSRVITFGRLEAGMILADLRYQSSGIGFSLLTWDGERYRLKQTRFSVWNYIQGGEDHSKYRHFIVSIDDSQLSTKQDVTKVFSLYESALGRYEVPVTFRMTTGDIVIGRPVFTDKTIRYRDETTK